MSHTWTSHVTHITESLSCHRVSHLEIRHFTHERAKPHESLPRYKCHITPCTCHVTHMNESRSSPQVFTDKNLEKISRDIFQQPDMAGTPLSNTLVARVREVGVAGKYVEAVAKAAPKYFEQMFGSLVTTEFSKVWCSVLQSAAVCCSVL